MTGNINVVTCLAWVKRGVAAENPDKIELTAEELENIIKQTQSDLQDLDDAESDSDDDEESSSTTDKKHSKKKENGSMEEDEYNFDQYDNESGDMYPTVGSIAMPNIDGKDPFIVVPEADDDDSEKEDDLIKPDDNLVLIGRAVGDASVLEVHIYNEREDSFYCHHDILLPAFPLCIEWLNFDPGEEKTGNLCAIGSMSPLIDVWDLDIVDSLEPAFTLGRKSSRKKKIKGIGHWDAVLDIVWNENFTHVLASGSVDRTVLLWDLENGTPVTKLSAFEEKVQSIKWQPNDTSSLLTGCADKLVRLFDCKVDNSFKSWETSGEVEKVVWNHARPNFCYVGTNVGTIECIDIRKDDKIIWKETVDEKEITGLSISSSCPGMLVSTSASGQMYIWDISHRKTALEKKILEEDFKLGSLQCLAANPDNPFVFCMGGDNKEHNLKVLNLLEKPSIKESFKNEVKTEKNDDEAMEIAEELQNLDVNVNEGTSKKSKETKKKAKKR